MSKHTPLLIFGLSLLGIGAYMLGRRYGALAAAPDYSALPPPPSLPPIEGVGTPPTPARVAAWEAIGFDVDVFPAGASVYGIDPPGSADAVSVSPACDLIAVGRGFWGPAIAAGASQLIPGRTVAQAVTQVLGSRLPAGCEVAATAAMTALRAELAERIVAPRPRPAGVGGFITPGGGKGPSGPGNWTPY